MAVTKEEFDQWLEEGKKRKAKYMISVCDTWDYDDYPVYVMEGEDLEKIKPLYSINMQRINEIIEL